jgi:branched-chain amino acid transport system substrate-binding protein
MKKALNKAGTREKMYEAYTQGDKDFNALVSKMKAAAIDVVYVGGYHTEAGLILRQMRNQGMKSQMISGDALATNEFWSITGAIGEGVLFTFGPDPRKRPTAAAVVKRFKDKGVDPEGYTLYTYAAIQVWVDAVTKAKTVDPKKVATTVRAGKWNTVLGSISFDRKGDITAVDYVFYRWTKDGKYEEIPAGKGS